MISRPTIPALRRNARWYLSIALALSVALAAAVLIGAGRNSVGDQKVQRFSTVRSGDARFQVLSPTLIRTEYAGDGSFLDAATFNAIGRDGFARTPYTSRTSDGWLILRTSAMTLKYKVGSGPSTRRICRWS